MTQKERLLRMKSDNLAEFLMDREHGCCGVCIYHYQKECTRRKCREGVSLWLDSDYVDQRAVAEKNAYMKAQVKLFEEDER